jgi:hypothetical protein
VAYEKTYDLFLTHAWRYHEDWTELGALLDAHDGLSWRNFSVPWHDPALDANTELGGRFIRNWLETQILPVHAVLFLAGVYAVKSNRRWLDLELELARSHGKPVIGVPAIGAAAAPANLLGLADEFVGWDAGQIIAAVDRRLAKG